MTSNTDRLCSEGKLPEDVTCKTHPEWHKVIRKLLEEWSNGA